MTRKRPSNPQISAVHLWVAGYLCSIVLAVGFVVLGIPHILRAPGSWQLGMSVVLLTIPLIATCVSFLQEPSARRRGWTGFVRAYTHELLDLGGRVLTIIAVLPWIAAQLLLVIGGILQIALAAMLLLGAIQHALGVHLDGISDFSGADLVAAAQWMAGLLGGMLLAGMCLLGPRRIAPLTLRIVHTARQRIATRLGNDST